MIVQITEIYWRKGRLILGEGSCCIFILFFVVFMFREGQESVWKHFFKRNQRKNNGGEGELLSFKKKAFYKKLLPKAMNIQQGEKQHNPLTKKIVEITSLQLQASLI